MLSNTGMVRILSNTGNWKGIWINSCKTILLNEWWNILLVFYNSPQAAFTNISHIAYSASALVKSSFQSFSFIFLISLAFSRTFIFVILTIFFLCPSLQITGTPGSWPFSSTSCACWSLVFLELLAFEVIFMIHFTSFLFKLITAFIFIFMFFIPNFLMKLLTIKDSSDLLASCHNVGRGDIHSESHFFVASRYPHH